MSRESCYSKNAKHIGQTIIFAITSTRTHKHTHKHTQTNTHIWVMQLNCSTFSIFIKLWSMEPGSNSSRTECSMELA